MMHSLLVFPHILCLRIFPYITFIFVYFILNITDIVTTATYLKFFYNFISPCVYDVTGYLNQCSYVPNSTLHIVDLMLVRLDHMMIHCLKSIVLTTESKVSRFYLRQSLRSTLFDNPKLGRNITHCFLVFSRFTVEFILR